MNEFKQTGGARIGMANATFPFATLKVNKEKLELNVSIIGNYIFQPQDIISIETYSITSFIGQGIKITHRIPNYNQKIIFWTLDNPERVLNKIKETGFIENINSEISLKDLQIIEQQKQGGFPLKKSAVIVAFILWNLLLIIDISKFVLNDLNGMPFGKWTITAIGLLLLSAILTLFSSNFRNLILKEKRKLEDIKGFLLFIIIISVFLLPILLILTNEF